MRRPEFSRHAAVVGLAMLVLFAQGLAAPALAQHTPDPYNIVGEYNAGYENSMYPTYPNGAGYSPNQGVLQGRSGVAGSNQFQSYLDDLDGGGGGGGNSLFGLSGRGRGGVEPYYRAHRQFDEVFNRIYTPNEEADKTFYKDQKSRTAKYLEYLREADPRKRALLYREYNQQSLQAARDFGSGSSRAALRGGMPERSTAPAAPAASGRPSSLTPAPRSSTARPGSTLPARRATTPSTPGRAPLPGALDTPDQILNRSEMMDRANRATTTPNRGSTAVTPLPR